MSTENHLGEPAPSPIVLTPAELNLLRAYRSMDDETREDAIEMMQILAKRFPPAPRFRLVANALKLI